MSKLLPVFDKILYSENRQNPSTTCERKLERERNIKWNNKWNAKVANGTNTEHVKVPMQRNFTERFLDCIAKII